MTNDIVELQPEIYEDPLSLRNRLLSQIKTLVSGSNLTAALQLLKQFENATIDDDTLDETDRIIQKYLLGGSRLVATCNPARTAAYGEHVIIYGNYPHCFDNLLVNGLSRRHVSWFWRLKHDLVESNSVWDPIDQIYIINKDSRIDRYDAVLNELARAEAPLDRIERLPAILPSEDRNIGWDAAARGAEACLMSHISALEHARRSGKSNFLVLEDDFCFTSDRDCHLQDLQKFFMRGYDYWVCLLATSKYGLVVKKDDLMSYSLQPCTNAAAYLISAEGIEQLLPVWNTALQQMRQTGEITKNAADRSWSVLQKSGRFLVFRKKMGFQQSSLSDIEGKIARYFD